MSRPLHLALLALAALLLQACASAPKMAKVGIDTGREMTVLRDETHRQAQRFLDADAVLAAASVGLPAVTVADDARVEGITELQAALVANRAAREVCNGLAPYYRIVEQAPELQIELRITAVRATSRGAAGVSEVLGFFVPGPFRLPAGLGGLGVDGAARRDGVDLLVLRWAEGANPITEGAKVSTIGDAYQLAGDFAKDFVKALVDPNGDESPNRDKLATDAVAANKALCLARFGRASVAGRGASFLIPLAPEAIDAGAPVLPEAEAVPVEEIPPVPETMPAG